MGRRKLSMCFSIHCNQLICLVNDDFTSIWCINEIQDFKPGKHHVQQTESHFKDGILMWKNAKIPFIYYDLEICNITHLAVDERSDFVNHRLPIPPNNKFSSIIMYKNLFPLTSRMNSFNGHIPFPTTWF